jgi:hypothetical protein
MDVKFLYKIGQKVKTIFGDIGIVDMAAIDDSKAIKYYIKRSSESQWFKESEISNA